MFGDDATMSHHLIIEPGIFLRIDIIDTAAKHSDRAGGQGSLMGSSIYASGQPRHDNDSRLPQANRQFAGKALACGGGNACANHGDAGAIQQLWVPKGPDQRWCGIQGSEAARK